MTKTINPMIPPPVPNFHALSWMVKVGSLSGAASAAGAKMRAWRSRVRRLRLCILPVSVVAVWFVIGVSVDGLVWFGLVGGGLRCLCLCLWDVV